MSKESALTMAMGTAPGKINPSLITPETTVVKPTPVAETPPAVETKEKTDDLTTSRLAIFAKKEAALQKEREDLKRQREEWLKEKEEAQAVRTKAKEFDELRKKDPIAALKAIGIEETEIFNFLSAAEKKELTPEEAARKVAQEESQKLRTELAAEKAELEKTKNQRLIDNFKTDIRDKIKAEAETYEYCAFEGASAEAQAYEFVVENLKLNGDMMPIEEALKMTEELYEARDKAMANLKKRQPKQEDPPPVQTNATPSRTRTTNTPPVSNVPQAQAPVKPAPVAVPPGTRKETPSQKRERLMEALRNGGMKAAA